eukprot:1185977-Prorocentrum_minimum.AAC.1
MTTDTEACNLASWHSSVSEITGAPIVYSALLTADVRGPQGGVLRNSHLASYGRLDLPAREYAQLHPVRRRAPLQALSKPLYRWRNEFSPLEKKPARLVGSRKGLFASGQTSERWLHAVERKRFRIFLGRMYRLVAAASADERDAFGCIRAVFKTRYFRPLLPFYVSIIRYSPFFRGCCHLLTSYPWYLTHALRAFYHDYASLPQDFKAIALRASIPRYSFVAVCDLLKVRVSNTARILTRCGRYGKDERADLARVYKAAGASRIGKRRLAWMTFKKTQPGRKMTTSLLV